MTAYGTELPIRDVCLTAAVGGKADEICSGLSSSQFNQLGHSPRRSSQCYFAEIQDGPGFGLISTVHTRHSPESHSSSWVLELTYDH